MGSIPGSGRSLGGGHGNPLQYSCLVFHGQRSLASYSPWGCTELDMTEATWHAHAGFLYSSFSHSTVPDTTTVAAAASLMAMLEKQILAILPTTTTPIYTESQTLIIESLLNNMPASPLVIQSLRPAISSEV